MSLLFLNKVTINQQAFEEKVKEISYKLGINPNWLMFLIDWESAGSFSPSKENSFGCVGLIQFCSDAKGLDYKTIGGVQYKMSAIKAMSNVEQLNLVYEYLKPYKGDMKSFYDLYFAILWPIALGENDSYVIKTGTNPVFDLNKNGQITVEEVKEFLNDRVKKLVPLELQNEFLKKNSTGLLEPVKRNALQIYQREVRITVIIIILFVALWFLYKKIK